MKSVPGLYFLSEKIKNINDEKLVFCRLEVSYLGGGQTQYLFTVVELCFLSPKLYSCFRQSSPTENFLSNVPIQLLYSCRMPDFCHPQSAKSFL